MAIDNNNKKLSVMMHGSPAQPMTLEPSGDSVVSEGDKHVFVYQYHGLTWGAAPAGPPKFLPEQLAFEPLTGIR